MQFAARLALGPLLVLFTLCAVVGLVWSVLRKNRKVSEPACGKCGYSVRGLPTFTCPECGSDLHEVGIVIPTRDRVSGPLAGLAVWTLLLPWPILLATVAILPTFFPYVYQCQAQRVIFCQWSNLFTTLRVTVESKDLRWGGRQWNVSIPPQRMTLSIDSPSGAPVRLQVDLPSKTCHLLAANGKLDASSQQFGPESLLAWLKAASFNTDDPAVAAHAQDILTAIDETPRAQGKFTRLTEPSGAPGLTAHPTSFFTNVQSPPWSAAAQILFWLTIWLLGCAWIVRRYRRSMATVTTTT